MNRSHLGSPRPASELGKSEPSGEPERAVGPPLAAVWRGLGGVVRPIGGARRLAEARHSAHGVDGSTPLLRPLSPKRGEGSFDEGVVVFGMVIPLASGRMK